MGKVKVSLILSVLLIPIILVFLSNYAIIIYDGIDNSGTVLGYIIVASVLGVIFPIISGILCAKIAKVVYDKENRLGKDEKERLINIWVVIAIIFNIVLLYLYNKFDFLRGF